MIDNAQVLCRAHNRAKGAAVSANAEIRGIVARNDGASNGPVTAPMRSGPRRS